MDAQQAASIKINSRLKPAKDIHIVFSNLLANKDPEQVPVLRQKMINLIDAAEIEYQLLSTEITNMENICKMMETENEEMNQAIENLNDQIHSFQREKDIIGERIEKRNYMNELKIKLDNKKNVEIVHKINELNEDCECIQEKINKSKVENEKIDKGFKMIVQGFQSIMTNNEEEENETQ